MCGKNSRPVHEKTNQLQDLFSDISKDADLTYWLIWVVKIPSHIISKSKLVYAPPQIINISF